MYAFFTLCLWISTLILGQNTAFADFPCDLAAHATTLGGLPSIIVNGQADEDEFYCMTDLYAHYKLAEKGKVLIAEQGLASEIESEVPNVVGIDDPFSIALDQIARTETEFSKEPQPGMNSVRIFTHFFDEIRGSPLLSREWQNFEPQSDTTDLEDLAVFQRVLQYLESEKLDYSKGARLFEKALSPQEDQKLKVIFKEFAHRFRSKFQQDHNPVTANENRLRRMVQKIEAFYCEQLDRNIPMMINIQSGSANLLTRILARDSQGHISLHQRDAQKSCQNIFASPSRSKTREILATEFPACTGSKSSSRLMVNELEKYADQIYHLSRDLKTYDRNWDTVFNVPQRESAARPRKFLRIKHPRRWF